MKLLLNMSDVLFLKFKLIKVVHSLEPIWTALLAC